MYRLNAHRTSLLLAPTDACTCPHSETSRTLLFNVAYAYLLRLFGALVAPARPKREHALVITLLAASIPSIQAQDLPRRPFFGAHITPASDGGVSIAAIASGAPADQAGLEAGDLIVKAAGTDIDGLSAFLDALARAGAGTDWDLEVVRDGEVVPVTVPLEEFPRLSSRDFDYEYGAVEAEGALRRTIVTVPYGDGPHAGVLLVGGVSCYSLDVPAPQPHPYLLLREALTRAGYATLWVEKSGMGDSQGIPCSKMNFDTALAGYRAGLQALKARPDVDAGRVFILGHSMGGLIAPLLAAEDDVAGVVAIETAGLPWMEYLLANLRRQLPLEGLTPPQVDAAMREGLRAKYTVFIEERDPQDILDENPLWDQFIALPQHVSYMRQVASYDPAAVWTAADAPVLLVAGGADFVTDPAEHEHLETVIAGVRPGTVTYTLIDDLDHFLNRVADQASSFRGAKAGQPFGTYNTDLTEVVLDWLDAHD